MVVNIYYQLGILFHLFSIHICWQYFTSLTDLNLMNSEKDVESIHSEYMFGDCKRPNKHFLVHIHKDHIEILGKIIVRGWLDLVRMPTCILLRATAYEEDTFRSTAYNFQFCVPRITYCHSQKRYKYFFYEWYIPSDFIGGMNWDIYFYGPISLEWQ